MGDYDMLPEGSQIKCWNCEYRTYKVGNSVPINCFSEYVVLLQEGGFIRVKDAIITEIVEDGKPRYPEDFPTLACMDKWAGIVPDREALKGRCMFGYDYYFAHKEKLDDPSSKSNS